MGLKQRRLLAVGMPFFVVIALAVMPVQVGAGTNRPGVHSDTDYAASYARANVTNVFATTQQVSCYRPEVPFFTTGTTDGYAGMTPCPRASTGEDTGAAGPYPNQVGSANGYPAASSMLVNDHSESDLRVDPNHPNHVIASSKWFVSAEGYNHVLGFYESWDGGKTWPVQGHIPGYEGFTDNTDPVGAFDGFGNFYEILLPYQFAYAGGADGTGSKLFQKSKLPNPAMPPESVSFFFQAEDGIRDLTVTGVQTCAPPISANLLGAECADGLINRHDAPVFRGIHLLAVQQLDLRIDHLQPRGPHPVDFHFAVKNQELSRFQATFEVAPMEKLAGKLATSFVLHKQVVNGVAAEAHVSNDLAAHHPRAKLAPQPCVPIECGILVSQGSV